MLVVGVALGLACIIVTAVKRGRRKRERWAAEQAALGGYGIGGYGARPARAGLPGRRRRRLRSGPPPAWDAPPAAAPPARAGPAASADHTVAGAPAAVVAR